MEVKEFGHAYSFSKSEGSRELHLLIDKDLYDAALIKLILWVEF